MKRSFLNSVPVMADINAYSADSQLILAVEVCGGAQSESEYLERMRAALMGRLAAAKALYLLLVQRNGLFLWRTDTAPATEPQFASIKQVIQDYAPSLVTQHMEPQANSLQILIYAWLDDLALGIRKPRVASEADQLLVKTGIYDQIRNGNVESES